MTELNTEPVPSNQKKAKAKKITNKIETQKKLIEETRLVAYKILKVKNLKSFRIRDLRESTLQEIKNNIKENGYFDARVLAIVKINDEYHVADGNHRLEALLALGIETVPCVVYENTDPYQIAIEGNIAENTYAPMDLFDWLNIIQKLKKEGLTQEEIGNKIGWSQRKVADYFQIIKNFSAENLEFCKNNQKGRALKNSALALFDFTEGWFRTSGLYDLQEQYQKRCLQEFIDEKCNWSKSKLQKETVKYKQWQEFLKITKNQLYNQHDLGKLAELIENNTFKTVNQLQEKIKDFNKDAKNKLICGDAVLELEKLEDASIDLVITDPPYGQEYNCWNDSYDSYVGNEGIINDSENIFIILEEICKLLDKKTKSNCHLYFFCSWKVEPQYREVIEKYFQIKNIITWFKGNDGAGDLIYNWGDSTEFIIYAIKGKRPLNKGKRKMNFLNIPRLDHTKRIHPTQKPVELINELLEVSSQSNDTLCDPFMGSGSTIKACKEFQDLHYIGIEIDPKIFEKATAFIGGK